MYLRVFKVLSLSVLENSHIPYNPWVAGMWLGGFTVAAGVTPGSKQEAL